MTRKIPGHVPKGLCQCGCGNKTYIATRNRPERTQIKGQPMGFLPGHTMPRPSTAQGPEANAKAAKLWREKRKHSELCNDCSNKTKELRCPTCKKKRMLYMRQRLKDPRVRTQNCLRRKERQIRLRKAIIEGYGGKCACCGLTVPEFLTLDHIHNDGAEHRKRDGYKAAGHHLYTRLVREGFPKGQFQLLCWNCNCAKSIFNLDECPHKRKVL